MQMLVGIHRMSLLVPLESVLVGPVTHQSQGGSKNLQINSKNMRGQRQMKRGARRWSWTIAFFKCHFHPLPFSVSPASVQISPTCRFHLLWYAIRYAPIPRSRTVSWVLCGWAGAHHPLNLAIERNFTQKKERKKHLLTDFMYFHLSYVMISVVGFCLHVKFTHGFLSPKKSIFTFLWENVK